jgi:hypothetical protein
MCEPIETMDLIRVRVGYINLPRIAEPEVIQIMRPRARSRKPLKQFPLRVEVHDLRAVLGAWVCLRRDLKSSAANSAPCGYPRGTARDQQPEEWAALLAYRFSVAQSRRFEPTIRKIAIPRKPKGFFAK